MAAPINILRAIFMSVQNAVPPCYINMTLEQWAPDLPVGSDKPYLRNDI